MGLALCLAAVLAAIVFGFGIIVVIAGGVDNVIEGWTVARKFDTDDSGPR